MKQIAITLRALQLFAHNAHNMAKGSTFLEDHEFLGDLYEAYEGSYDDVVERMIGEGDETDLNAIAEFAVETCAEKSPKNNDEAFATILEYEKELCSNIAKEVRGASDGTQNLLQGIADESLVRQYKIGRRLKE